MTTITNKKQYPSEQYLNELITNMEFAAMAPVEVVRVMAAELQERRKADNQEPAGYHVIKECGKVGCSVATLEEAEKTRDFWNKRWTIRPYFYSATPVVPPAIEPDYKVIKSILPTANPDEYACCIAADMWNACRATMLQANQRDLSQPVDPQVAEYEQIMLQAGNSPISPDGWISCSERMPVIGELNWRTSLPLLITCEIGVIPAYYGFVSVNGNKHYGFMESLKYGDDSGNHPQTNEYDLISNVTHWIPLPEPPQEVNRG
ncbi:hypothetical protein AHY74_04300 [Salmonella enterica subsp. enterica serovar Newport]|nr:hypothetical protein [Salmonella enterica subsp. enterica serovar Newport]